MSVVAHQRAALRDCYATLVPAGSRFALVDFPEHPNVGDSAIWLGEVALLREATGQAPAYVSTWRDFDVAAMRRACPDGPLLIHGGGNLGDIWPHHQRFREMLLETVRDRPVVQLPQTIGWRDARGADRFARLAAAHPDFRLLVRDARSLAFARARFGCPVALVPDAAFALSLARAAPTIPALALLRSDAEGMGFDRAPLAGVPIVDWLDEPPPDAADPTGRAAERVARGTALLSRAERIVTDRLHGHILALLLGIPHVVLDNDYGKIAAYRETWTLASPITVAAADPARAAALLAA